MKVIDDILKKAAASLRRLTTEEKEFYKTLGMKDKDIEKIEMRYVK